MKRLKKVLVVTLCASVLLQGCMVDRALTKDEREAMLSRQDVKLFFHLDGDSVVIAEPFHYVRVAEPTEGVFVPGELTNELRETTRDTALLVPSGVFDTAFVRAPGNGALSGQHDACRIYDSTTFRFNADELFPVAKEDGAGYACVGNVTTREGRRSFAGFVRDADINEVKVGEPSVVPTLVVLGVTVAIVFALVQIFKSEEVFSLGTWEGGWGW